MLAQAGLRQEIGWDYDGLVCGFHGKEPAEAHRWTNGEATIPAGLLAGMQAETVVELHVAGLLPYPLEQDVPDVGAQAA